MIIIIVISSKFIIMFLTNHYNRPFHGFSTVDWDQLAKIRQHGWKERLKFSKVAKFESDLFKSNEEWWDGGGSSCSLRPPTIVTSVKFRDFVEQYLLSLWTYYH